MTAAKIALVGAGLAGLTLARQLADHGVEITVFDKARGPGGRFANRRTESGVFDLGCQLLTARTPAFTQQLQKWQQEGLLAPWPASGSLTGIGRMSRLTRYLSQGLSLQQNTRITRLQRDEQGWWLQTDQMEFYGPYTQVVLATPASQAAALLPPQAEEMAEQLGRVEEAPAWVAYFAFNQPTGISVALEDDPSPDIRRITCLSSKPAQEAAPELWLVEASASWSQQHLDEKASTVATRLLHLWQTTTDQGCLSHPQLLGAHRWLYGRCHKALQQAYLADSNLGLYACGDYCLGADAEAAWQSAQALAKALQETIQ
ncbi:NAD(P)/FAD-dependent oxidoreductase [Marinospirillum perlucidum]|uniref:NAD(P)/FAD-dependent oxidoreductase n=1 Tax=Marinospirillum perlucidum TaxID=1982602 RepID=UPI000DF21681|nr:FAD-dependent oxidoreductase [Marinospirillum perlucidum]